MTYFFMCDQIQKLPAKISSEFNKKYIWSMKSRIAYLILLIMIWALNIQAEETDPEPVTSSAFKASMSYLTNAVYYGRKDTLKLPYLTPTFGYYHKSGLFFDTSLSYKTKSPGQVDLITLEGGYEFSIGENFSGGISASKYFYSKNSTSTKSNIKGEAMTNASYSTSVLTFNTGLDVALSQKTDILLSYGISHPFYIGEEQLK